MFGWTLHLDGAPELYEWNEAVAFGRHVYSFGRNNIDEEIDVIVLNTVSMCWRKLTPVTPGTGKPHLEVPSRRRGHTVVLIEYTVYLWGGRTDPGKCNELYAFDVDAHTWFKPQVSGTIPEERYNHSACVLEKVMFIQGGWTQTGLTHDIYKLDTSTMVWALINTRGTLPPDSYYHSATIIGTKMFVFVGGGRRYQRYQYYNTIRVFDTETNQWMNTPSARLLLEHNYSVFTYSGELYIFGGCNDKHAFNDLWKFNPETFSWRKVEHIKGKRPHGMIDMCCRMLGDRVILSGAGDRPGDLYVLDFSPSLKTLCKLAVIQYGLEQSELTHDVRWELAAMTSTKKRKPKIRRGKKMNKKDRK